MRPNTRRFMLADTPRMGLRLLGLVLVLGAGACASPLAKIDARTAEMLRQQSEILGVQAASPRTTYRDQERLAKSDAAYREPDTRNPDAGELSFTALEESRDVEARLAQYLAASSSGEAMQLTLSEVLRLAQANSRDFRQAEEEYILAAVRLLIEEHRWGPRFFADTGIVASGSGSDGSFEHAVDLVNTLRATKRLPYGGEVEARLVWNATENLREQATGRYRQSSRLVLSGDIPLMRGAGLVAREDLIQRRRDLVYAARTFERFRRQLVLDFASDYFDLVSSQNRIINQEARLEGLRYLQVQTGELVEAGRLRAFQQDLARSQVLGAEAQLANLRESFQLQLDRFKVRLALPIDQAIVVVPVRLAIPEPDSTIEAVTEMALAYRLDLQNQRDRVEDQKRSVAIARNQLQPDLNLGGDLSIPTDPDSREGGIGLDPEELDYSASLTLGWPLDREIEQLNLRSSLIAAERSIRDYEESRDNVVVDARSALRNVELSRLRLNLAEQQVIINERRLEEQRTRADELNPQEIVDTENDLNNARNDRDQAASDLKVAVLRYMLQTGQLRVTRDGWIAPPEGMPTVTEEASPPPVMTPYAPDQENP